jgi:hypothetical protein
MKKPQLRDTLFHFDPGLLIDPDFLTHTAQYDHVFVPGQCRVEKRNRSALLGRLDSAGNVECAIGRCADVQGKKPAYVRGVTPEGNGL